MTEILTYEDLVFMKLFWTRRHLRRSQKGRGFPLEIEVKGTVGYARRDVERWLLDMIIVAIPLVRTWYGGVLKGIPAVAVWRQAMIAGGI